MDILWSTDPDVLRRRLCEMDVFLRATHEWLSPEEQRAQLLMRCSHPIAFTGLDGALIECNAELLRVLGYESAAPLVQQPVSALWCEPERTAAVLERLRSEKCWCGEVAICGKEARRFAALLSASVLYDEAGDPADFLFSLLNVVPRPLGEATLEKRGAAQPVETLLSMVPHGLLIFKLNGRPLYADPFVVDVLGYDTVRAFLEASLEDLEDHVAVWDDAGQPMAFPAFSALMVGVHERSEPFVLRLRILPDGAVRRIVIQGTPIFDGAGALQMVALIVQDVTGIQKMEVSLRNLYSVLDQVADHVNITDREGRIQYVNPAFEESTGYRFEEIVGKTPNFLRSGEHPLPFYRELWETLLSGRPFQAIFKNRRKDGAVFCDEKTITPIRDTEGNVTHFISTGRDITRRIQREEVLRRRNRELGRLNAELQHRNEDLDAFAHTVAHDLKNPLALVQGYAQVLREDLADLSHGEIEKSATTIVRQSQKMEEIIDALLLLASVSQKEMEVVPIDMGEIVAEVVRRVTPLVEDEGATLVVSDDWPRVLGYAPWVEQVWFNYVTNALKYGGDPPRVELCWASLPGKDQVRFCVQDRGPGIEEEDLDKLFRPFENLNRARRGHGLGLSIVRRIVHKLGGDVSAECRTGGGCRFIFTLPVIPGDAEQEAAE